MVREFAPGLEVPPEPPPPPPSLLKRHATALSMAVVGGVFAVVGSFIEELRAGGAYLFLPVVLAPVVEEVLKPSGVVWLLERRPHYLTSSLQVVLLCIVGALVFASLENLLYIHLYWPLGRAGRGGEGGAVDGSARRAFIHFRLVAATGLHLSASAIVGVGLARQLKRMRCRGENFDLERSFPFLLAAMILHGVYNACVILAENLGWNPWD